MTIKKKLKEVGSAVKLVGGIPKELIKRVFTDRNQTASFPDMAKKSYKRK